MRNMNEELLEAWLRLSIMINNERLVSDMPYNEALICNILYRNQKREPGKNMTATDLCNETRMLKSQMNRTLNSLEEKKVIKRQRSEQDKRQILIYLNEEQSDIYNRQHEKILELLGTVVEKFGKDRTSEIITLFTMISDTLEGVM
ncbi:MAG: transcriptional regulator, SarA/Rot family [Eubacterium sp.]